MKQFLVKAFLALATALLPCPAHCQLAWVQRHHGSSDIDTVPTAMTVDGSGNVFVTGYATDPIWEIKDWVTVAYSSTGTPVWTNRYNGTGDEDDQPNAVAVDSNGNVFVTGVSLGSDTGQDCVTIKYSSAGVPLWTRRYNGAGGGNDGGNALAVDGNGAVIVTGVSVGTNGFSSYFDFATIKYSGAGVPLWTNRYNGPANNYDGAIDVAVDGSDNVFVTGQSDTIEGSADFLTIAYSRAGVPLWTNRYNGPGNNSDYVKAVAVDGSGNVFVTGDSWGDSAQDFATIKYSAAGVPLWTNRYHGTWSGNNFAAALAVDGGGNVIVTGGDGGFGSTNGGYVTIKYSNSGVPLWTNHFNGPVTALGYNDNARAVRVDGSGNVFVTGQSFRDLETSDYVTLAYSSAGVALWTNRYNGPANGDDIPLTKRSLVLGPDGGVHVTGASDGDSSDGRAFDFATVKYVALPDAPSLSITRTNALVIISWPLTTLNFQLQVTTNLALPNSWSPVGQPAVTNAGELSIDLPATVGNRFFRLKSP